MWIKTYAGVSLDYIKVRITHITNFLVIVRDIILSHALLLVFCSLVENLRSGSLIMHQYFTCYYSTNWYVRNLLSYK